MCYVRRITAIAQAWRPYFFSFSFFVYTFPLTDSMLRHCLPDKVFEKFSQALSRDALTAAKMEGMVSCYHCSMQMQMEEDAGNVLFALLLLPIIF